eukprot:TRINITY_DN38994_c0_g1_i1.p1 TRINITY_DN38994_c0_g1~~TRINITY_DN38994_c0_g1_i1.p1  ORF type:complete len:149 (-),score=21.39 TRINITY_DN38994_c0_g1_i1:379-825(-)
MCIRDRMRRYCEMVCGTTLVRGESDLNIELEKLTALVRADRRKEVGVLTVSAGIGRRVGGARWVSCKSAKDRTSMLCTLEAVEACFEDKELGIEPSGRLVQSLRCGVRLDNCLLNMGKRAYAFNRMQVATFPTELQPPEGTYGQGGRS